MSNYSDDYDSKGRPRPDTPDRYRVGKMHDPPGLACHSGCLPTQPLGKDTCANCGEPIHLANHQLGPVWLHDANGLAWCELTAKPSSRPWPEMASP